MENNSLIKSSEGKKTMERSEFLKQVGISVGAIVLMQCVQGCTEGEIPDPNPNINTGKVDITLDLNTSDYSALKTKGGFAYIKANGIIAAQTSAGAFIAVASACTHAGTTVNFRANTTDFYCPNHGSVFSSTGAVTTGPATAALKRFSTSFDATNNKLRIFE